MYTIFIIKRQPVKKEMHLRDCLTAKACRYYEEICTTTELLLGRVALVAQRPLVVKLSCVRSAGLSLCTYVRTYVRACVHRSVCPVHCGKTAHRIRMPFGIIGRTGPGMRQIVRFGDRSTGRGTYGDEFGARHYNPVSYTHLTLPTNREV